MTDSEHRPSVDDLDRTRQRCLSLADSDGSQSPLYDALLRTIASDDEMCALIATARPGQRRPVLFLAAVHDLLLAGADHDLAAWYPTCGGQRLPSSAIRPDGSDSAYPGCEEPGPAHVIASSELAAAFRSFVLDQRAQITARLAVRSTQTNEVGRSTALLVALGEVARRAEGRPLHLIELGASAGLTLIPERYRHELRSIDTDPQVAPTPGSELGPASAISRFGATNSALTLRCGSTGRRAPAPGPELVIAGRTGIDLAPLDVTRADDLRWLRACVWPDQPERHDRLSAAATVMTHDPVTVMEGDLRTDAGAACRNIASDAVPVVWHGWALTYVQRDERHLLAEQLSALDEVWWLSAEFPGVVPGLGVEFPSGPADELSYSTVLGATHIKHGATHSEVWGRMQPHGRWLDWHLGEPINPSTR